MMRLLNLKTILAAYLILAIGYSLITPVFEAPDEMAHSNTWKPDMRFCADLHPENNSSTDCAGALK